MGSGLLHWFYIVSGELFTPLWKRLIALLRINTEVFSWHFFQGLRTFFLVNLGFVFFLSHLPLVSGNLHTVIDMALIGLVLSVFRGGRVLRDEPARERSRFKFPWRVKISIISTKES